MATAPNKTAGALRSMNEYRHWQVHDSVHCQYWMTPETERGLNWQSVRLVLKRTRNTPYRGFIVFIRVECPDDYPFVAPTVILHQQGLWHPNMEKGTEIPLDLLKKENWKPTFGFPEIASAVIDLLGNPFPDEYNFGNILAMECLLIEGKDTWFEKCQNEFLQRANKMSIDSMITVMSTVPEFDVKENIPK